MKVTCPCIECKFNDNLKCTCKVINLTFRSMNTINEGRVNMWVCDKYELSNEAEEMFKIVEEILELGRG